MLRGIVNFDTDISKADLSKVLQRSGINHYIMYDNRRAAISASEKEQVFYPTIVSTMSSIRHVKDGAIFGLIPKSVYEDMGGTCVQVTEIDIDIAYYMDQWLEYQPLPEFHKKTPHEYVCTVSPPSFLDTYQTIVCKVNPYDFRKKVMAAVIRFINGKITKKKLFALLMEKPKSAQLIDIMDNNKELDLLCQQVQSGEPSMDFSVRYMRSALLKL